MSGFADGVTAPVVESVPQTEDYLSGLVGEGKQYGTIEEAAQGLAKKAVNADAFIETLKSEKHAVESQYTELQTRNRSIDEIVDALKTPVEPVEQPAVAAQQEPPKDLDAEIRRVVAESEAELKRTQAISNTWDNLANSFGGLDAAQAAVAKYINGDERKKSVIDSLALADPAALVNILKPTAEGVTFSENQSGDINTGSQPVGSKALTWDDVWETKESNPKLYNSKAFKLRMHNEL